MTKIDPVVSAAEVAMLGLDPLNLRFTRQGTLDAIGRLVAGGHTFSSETFPRLAKAVERYFGGWSIALAESKAGPWTGQRVILELRRLAASGQTVGDEIPRPLRYAAWRFFGGVPAARAAAGLDPFPAHVPPPHIRKTCLAALARRMASGAAITERALADEDPALMTSVRAHFDTLGRALDAMCPNEVALLGFRNGRPMTHSQIVTVVRRAVAAGHVLSAARFPRIAREVHHQFGSWQAALQEAGVAFDRQPRPFRGHVGPPTDARQRAKVMAALRARTQGGGDLRQRALATEAPELLVAACHAFGTLDAALRAARIRRAPDRRPVKRGTRMSREDVLAELRRLASEGRVISKQIPAGLRYAAWCHFGSLPDARVAAGLARTPEQLLNARKNRRERPPVDGTAVATG